MNNRDSGFDDLAVEKWPRLASPVRLQCMHAALGASRVQDR
jgi:hypothetical protein